MIGLPIVLASSLGLAPAAEPAAEPAFALPSLAATAATLQEAEEEEAPDGLWHGNLNVGLSRTEGNADVENYSLDFRALRDFDQHRYTVEALWYMARDNNRPDAAPSFLQRRALGSVKYDQFFSPTSRKTYFWLNALAETNFAAGIDLRWTVGAGLGHQWRDDDVWRINTEVGLAHFDEEFDNGDRFDYLAARLAWDVWHQLTETVQFGHFAELFPSLDDKDDVYGRANTYVETKLTENMVARLTWILVYDNTPAQIPDPLNAANLIQAERTDNIYTLTVGWTF